MRQILRLALAGSIAAAMSTAALAQNQTYDLSGFDRLDIANGIATTVEFGTGFSVRVEATSQQAIDNLKLSVEGNVLAAALDQSFLDFIMGGGLVGKLLSPGPAVKLFVTMPALAGVEASSGADVDIAGVAGDALSVNVSSGADVSVSNAAVGSISVDVSSGSDASLSGTCELLDVNASSGADTDASGLSCKNAKANSSSGSDISLFATGRVEANASSGGDIEIHGNPADSDIESSSGGDVTIVQ